MATCPCLRQQRSFCRQATLPSDHDKAAGGPLFPATTTKQQAGSSSLRQRQSCRQAVQYCDNGLPQAELLFFETTKIRIGRGIVAATTCRRRAVILAGTMVLHRFLISNPDLRIDAAKRSKQGQFLQPKGWSIITRRGMPDGQTRPREHSAPGTKKESRLIAESGLSKRGSYLLSHLV